MICPKCGAQVSEGAPFCPKCGATMRGVMSSGGSQMPPVNNGGYNGNNKGNNVVIIAAIITAAAVIFLLAGIFGSMYIMEVGPFEPEATATPVPTASPTPTPTPTPVPAQPTPQIVYVTQPPQTVQQSVSTSQSSVVSNPVYKTYSDSDYGFSCNYPSHFSVYNDGGQITRYTVQSQDGSARELIAATPIGSETVSSSLQSYINSHPGNISYKTSGSDYYAINIKNGATEYYKYCKFKNGNMYWFEFISPTAYHEVYDVYINDIYQSFNIY